MSGRSVEPALKLENRERWALAAAALIGVVTAGWWALALGPTPGTSPDWLVRARNVCFGSTESGLPNAGGWILLIGQPMGMLGVLVVAWWSEVRGGLRKVAMSRGGRVGLVAVGLLGTAGLAAAGGRVVAARQAATWTVDDLAASGIDPVPPHRIGRQAPSLALTDQSGRRVTLDAFAGRAVLVTFGFGHCETVCPLVVHSARRVQEELGADRRPALLVVTLDPWRDTPSRLPHLMEQWELAEDAYVLGGSVDDVNRALDAWNVPRARDPATGDITHPGLTFVVDREGRLAYASGGAADELLGLLETL